MAPFLFTGNKQNRTVAVFLYILHYQIVFWDSVFSVFMFITLHRESLQRAIDCIKHIAELTNKFLNLEEYDTMQQGKILKCRGCSTQSFFLSSLLFFRVFLFFLNLDSGPDIDWTLRWPYHIPSVQSKHGLLTPLYPPLTNQKRLRVANRKMSAFLCSPGRKSVSLKACWETFSFFPSFPLSLPWQTVMNWSLIWLPLCQTELSLSSSGVPCEREIFQGMSFFMSPLSETPPALTAAQQEHVSHTSHSELSLRAVCCALRLLGIIKIYLAELE